MGILHYLSGPLVGAVVGYVTNYIAIKMLFRPLKPVMIGRHRLPFTPGIVPKRKDMLAEILGRAIVDKFFNADDLEVVFKSDSMADAFADCIVALFNDEAIRLGDIRGQMDSLDSGLYDRTRDEICIRIQAAMLRADLPGLLAAEMVKALESRSDTGKIGGKMGQALLPLVSEPLSEKLEKFILADSRAVILPIIDDELHALGCVPLSEAVPHVFPDPQKLHRAARDLHKQFMGKFVRPIVESIDVGGMITEKVKTMTAQEVEGLVLDVVNRELFYVVVIGAVIGALIGAINIFI